MRCPIRSCPTFSRSGSAPAEPIPAANTIAVPLWGWGGWLALWLTLAWPAQGQTTSTNRLATHHLIVVENTVNMESQREQAADMVSRLLLNGFQSRARNGDVIELWLVETETITNAFQPTRWHPLGVLDESNTAFRFLRSLEPTADRARLASTITALDITNRAPDRLLVYLLTSGSDPIQGTPYDKAINQIFVAHGTKLREAGIPFMTVFLAQENAWAGHGVTPGDRPPYIPPFPPTKAEVAAEEEATRKANAPRIGQPLIVTNTAKPKKMTVAEIERELQRAALERARTSAPPASALTTTTQPPKTAEQLPPQNKPEIPPSPTTEPASLATNAPPPPAASAATEPSPPLPSADATTITAPEPKVVAATSAPPDTIRPSTSPKTTLTTEPTPGSSPPAKTLKQPSPWRHLAVGTLLLVAAVALGVILVRNLTHHHSPSLITESLRQPPEQSDRGS